jgi:uncharacterized damage-inducible protein DinB
MRPKSLAFSVAIACVATVGVTMLVHAQAPAAAAANPISGGSKVMFQIVSGYVTKSADKASEEIYAFKPTPEVRSFGQIIGHVADDHYGICAAALGEKPPVEGIEKSKTTKADLVKALADSVAYCQKAYSALTDASGAEVVPFFGQKMARLSVLDFNTAHDYEHYGNLVTYMRLKGIVPPSSERQPGR